MAPGAWILRNGNHVAVDANLGLELVPDARCSLGAAPGSKIVEDLLLAGLSALQPEGVHDELLNRSLPPAGFVQLDVLDKR